MSGIEVVTVGAGGWPRVLHVDELAFGYSWGKDTPEVYKDILELDRTLVATVDGEDAGIASTYSLQMSLPGVPRAAVAGLTWVGVMPTHRRRGVLTALMRRHLDELHEENREPVAALFASEPSIYGRFGYGLATSQVRVSIPREFARITAAVTPDEPQVRFVDAQDVRPQLALVADRVAAQRAGVLSLTPRWWDRTLSDEPAEREGASALRTLLVADDSGPRGYALYHTREKWQDGGAAGSLEIREAMTVDPAAHRALWRVLLGTDLMGEVSYRRLPVDDPLLQLLVDPRRARPTVGDAVHVRVVDVARALAARTYVTDVDVVFELLDPFCPWNAGRWRLTGGPYGAACTPTTEEPHLALDATVLGGIYLGGTALRGFADAGRVEEIAAGAVDAVSRAFLAVRQPWCQVVF